MRRGSKCWIGRLGARIMSCGRLRQGSRRNRGHCCGHDARSRPLGLLENEVMGNGVVATKLVCDHAEYQYAPSCARMMEYSA